MVGGPTDAQAGAEDHADAQTGDAKEPDLEVLQADASATADAQASAPEAASTAQEASGPQLPIDVKKFIDYGKDEGYEITPIKGAEVKARFGWTKKQIETAPLFYSGSEKKIFINLSASYWKDTLGNSQKQSDLKWWVSSHPLALVDHEIGHAKHHESLKELYFRASLRQKHSAALTRRSATPSVGTQRPSRLSSLPKCTLG